MIQLAMVRATLLHLLRGRGHAWLLALALCLPFAQWASATHALLHLHAAVGEERETPAQAPSACDLCVVAATLGNAAPPAGPQLPLAGPLPSAPPLAALTTQRAAERFTSYRSRAPPSLHA
jgi:hypothetical protein